MIKYIEGDLFSSPAQVITNTVNTVGVMGKGLALSFKQLYPEMFEFYQEICEKKELDIGKLILWRAVDHWLLQFPTKKHWRNDSKLEYIEAGLKKFVDIYDKEGITSVAFPCLGCGNGGLNWKDVKLLMEKYLSPLPIDVYVYVGNYEDEKKVFTKAKEFNSWLLENARSMFFNDLIEDIKNVSGIVPYEFRFQKDRVFASYVEDNLEVKENDITVYSFNEEELFLLWADVRRQKVIECSNEEPKINVFFALLNALNYLTKVRVLQNNGEKHEGYQLNEALSRVYWGR